MIGESIEHTGSRRAIIGLGSLILIALVAMATAYAVFSRPAEQPAPEAARVLEAQARLPFQILIPAYLPSGFDRANVKIQPSATSPAVELEYRGTASVVIIREWMPGQPNQETLIGAHPIDTKWGKGLLRRGTSNSFAALWADIGSLRVGVYSPPGSTVTQEELLGILETMGPAANRQVFTYLKEKPSIREAAPPPPVKVRIDDNGLQDISLIVTPSGYSPPRFALQKGIPARLTFRQLGQVGCGNTLVFPASPSSPTILYLASPQDKQVLEFVPLVAGAFEFHCRDNHYQGVMIVQDG